ncbi:MAG: DsrE family protein [Gammaproteobacteria bacterium]
MKTATLLITNLPHSRQAGIAYNLAEAIAKAGWDINGIVFYDRGVLYAKRNQYYPESWEKFRTSHSPLYVCINDALKYKIIDHSSEIVPNYTLTSIQELFKLLEKSDCLIHSNREIKTLAEIEENTVKRDSNKSLLFIIQASPITNHNSQVAFDLLLQASSFEFDIQIVFINNGVFQLYSGLNNSKKWKGLKLLEISKLYIDENDLKLREINVNQLLLPVKLINRDILETMKNEFDFIFEF